MRNSVEDIVQSPFIHDADHAQILMQRYDRFAPMETAIQIGDAETVWEILSGNYDSIHEVNRRYTPEEENQYQTFARLITIQTVLLIPCYRAGVHPLFIHSVSRRFDKKIAQCPMEEELVLAREMVDTYCGLIREAQMEHYGEFSDRVSRILLSQLSDPPSLKELAEQMYMSPATLTRRLKKETGKTLPEFLTQIRIKAAKLYMLEEGRTLGEVAQTVGFCDASYFSKVFTRSTGMTPTQYLRSQKKDPL